jgi:hypothetical protein
LQSGFGTLAEDLLKGEEQERRRELALRHLIDNLREAFRRHPQVRGNRKMPEKVNKAIKTLRMVLEYQDSSLDRNVLGTVLFLLEELQRDRKESPQRS